MLVIIIVEDRSSKGQEGIKGLRVLELLPVLDY